MQTKSEFDHALSLALDMGATLLSVGGSTTRAETIVNKICLFYGATRCDVLILNNTIACDITLPDEDDITQMKKIYAVSNNFTKMEKVNAYVDRVIAEKMSVDEAERGFSEVKKCKGLPAWVGILGGGFAVGACSVLNGGSLADGLIATVIGFLLVFLTGVLSRFSFNGYAKSFLLSFVGGVCSILLCDLFLLAGITVHVAIVMIGTLMIIIPGLPMCNAVRDLFAGDTYAGTSEIISGMLGTITVAIGYAVAMSMLSGILTQIDPLPYEGFAYYLFTILGVLTVSVGFALFFHIPYKRLVLIVPVTAISYACLILINHFTGNSFAATLVAAAVASVFAETFARVYRCPTTIYLIPSVLPLIPGGQLYNAMYHLVRLNGDMAWSFGLQAILLFVALGVGLSAVSVFFQIILPVKNKVHIANRYRNSAWWMGKKRKQ